MRFASTLGYPLVFALNRPFFYRLAKLLYDFALQCNGFAIEYPGSYGLTKAEENFLWRVRTELDNKVLIDIGANVGNYCNFLARIAPGATIYAFEPHPKTFATLVARALSPNIHPANEAVADRKCTMQLHDFANGDGSTQASLCADAVKLFEENIVSHEVRCTTIDDFIESNGIQHVGLVKIDTEGYDLAVLRGAKRAIAQRRFELIEFEFIPANIVTGATMRDFFETLHGYEIFRLCVNGSLLPLSPYDVKRCEVFVVQHLIAKPIGDA